MSGFDDIVRRSLTEFAAESLCSDWRGRREREAVSLYVFRHLLREVRPDSVLRDPAQITIEFPVPQVAESGKLQVCKDIVIWSEPAMSCWDDDGQPTVAPSVILEWKFGAVGTFAPDVEWLRSFSKAFPGFIGYAVTANRPGAGALLRCDRIAAGEVHPAWINL